MTTRERDLHDAWSDLQDAEAEHDGPRACRCWARLQQMQHDMPEQRERDCE